MLLPPVAAAARPALESSHPQRSSRASRRCPAQQPGCLKTSSVPNCSLAHPPEPPLPWPLCSGSHSAYTARHAWQNQDSCQCSCPEPCQRLLGVVCGDLQNENLGPDQTDFHAEIQLVQFHAHLQAFEKRKETEVMTRLWHRQHFLMFCVLRPMFAMIAHDCWTKIASLSASRVLRYRADTACWFVQEMTPWSSALQPASLFQHPATWSPARCLPTRS
mmetsp:Transcript_82264/g.155075  ORF Transcript_82264/g.155075 Transcript_82264/m.155075 type:complete len:218 (-) Transcript_82264:170-823(-)